MHNPENKKSIYLKDLIYQLNTERVTYNAKINNQIEELRKELIKTRIEENDYYGIESLGHYNGNISKLILVYKLDDKLNILDLSIKDKNEFMFILKGQIYYYGKDFALIKNSDSDKNSYKKIIGISYGQEIKDNIISEPINIVGYLELSV